MGTYTQRGGLFKIDTPLGEDVLLLRGFKGTEGISRLFNFQLDLLSEDPSIVFPDIIGKNVTISLKQPDGSYRYLNGIISRFAQEATEEQFTSYTAEMVPRLWLLTRNADCRIFKKKTVPEIITQVFSDLDFNDYANSLQSSYEPREYCVQYRESSFNFVSRLMEWEGIFYFFKHEQGRHMLVLADAPTAHNACPGQSSVRYVGVSGGPQEDTITGWKIEQELRAGKYTHTDYNFQTPTTSLMTSEPTVHEVGGNSKFEIYDYPGEHLTKSAGQSLAKIRMQEIEAGHLVAQGTSHCRMFVSGYKFALEEHPRQDQNTDYVLTEIQHIAITDAYGTQGSTQGESYSNTFKCIPHSVPYRPQRVTTRPALHSLQPAIVIGSGEINTDQYGRVQVTFLWNRRAESSAWCRVTQQWAGSGYGAMFIPRVGMEVYVDFEEGHPDCPVVVGCVYNAQNKPHHPLPDFKDLSEWTSRTSEGGGEDQYNAIAMLDRAGAEELGLRAQRDMFVHVIREQEICVEGNRVVRIRGNSCPAVPVVDTLTVDDGDCTIDVLKGNHTTTAKKSITLKVGQSSITLEPTGVTIKGLNIQIEGQTLTKVSAPATVVGGDATLALTGGVVTITGPVTINGHVPMLL